MSASESPRDVVVLQALERHQRQRRRALPTVTVLVGPAGAALSLWSQWLRGTGRAEARVGEPTEEEALRAWVEALGGSAVLEGLAADWLGRGAGLGGGELPSRLRGRTGHEREVLLQPLFSALAPGDAAEVCRALLLRPEGSHTLLEGVLAACGENAVRGLAAVQALVPEEGRPALLFTGEGAEWTARAARVAARLSDAVPSLVAALAVDEAGLEACLRGPGERAFALAREGVVEVPAPTAEALGERLRGQGVRHTEAMADTLERLAAEGVSEALLGLYGEAARAREAVALERETGSGREEARAEDEARSAEERFLFECLESRPETRGLFKLNGGAGFRFGGREAEVDLLCRRWGIALELDGYFHFEGPERWRRDRRKDWELQRHGYVVLRFLSEDVVKRLEEILDTVSHAVALRRDGGTGSAPR